MNTTMINLVRHAVVHGESKCNVWHAHRDNTGFISIYKRGRILVRYDIATQRLLDIATTIDSADRKSIERIFTEVTVNEAPSLTTTPPSN